MKRRKRIELHYRTSMRDALLQLLVVMNPTEQIEFGALTYSELLDYALAGLQIEAEEISSLSKPEPLAI